MRTSYAIITCLLAASLVLAGCDASTNRNDNVNIGRNTNVVNTSNDNTNEVSTGETDDWMYSGPKYNEEFTGSALGSTTTSSTGASYSLQFDPASAVSDTSFTSASVKSDNLGFSVGGAKDINAFRDDINANKLPVNSDLTYEGIFYDYFFDTGEQGVCEKLFCPSYSYAVTKDPISANDDYYVSVGLNSGIKESDFQRKKLNVVVVLDISGSMGSAFDQYYYDSAGIPTTKGNEESEESMKTKMELANESVVELLGHLNADDRFGMVLFDDYAYRAKPLTTVGSTDMDAIKDHILELQEQGGTNMSAGMEEGTALFSESVSELGEVDPNEYENRIIFLTDAQPNSGDTTAEGMFGMIEKNAANKIYTTVIGVGVDFNTDLIEQITNTYGANYYTVASATEFKEQMDEGFDFMVTPLVFNLKLQLEANGYDIEQVYGSPDADIATGEIMSVKTLFPSKTESGETRGGLILLKLKKTSDSPTLKLTTSYEDRYGNTDGETSNIDVSAQTADYYQNSGIRKGVLLARYADLLKNWIIDERKSIPQKTDYIYTVSDSTGIIVPPMEPSLGKWERTSEPLHVEDGYKNVFSTFSNYFSSEMQAIGDTDLQQELDVLNKLKAY